MLMYSDPIEQLNRVYCRDRLFYEQIDALESPFLPCISNVSQKKIKPHG